ncbi:MAG: 50S ribosomal protein L18 [Candidatus Firestonebacteria bacterium]
MKTDKKIAQKKRHIRIRKKIFGTMNVPRLCVFRSQKHISVQAVDDETGKVITGCATYSPELKGKLTSTKNISAAKALGELMAKKLLKKEIIKVVFDRSGYLYHGRIKELADSARNAGLKF